MTFTLLTAEIMESRIRDSLVNLIKSKTSKKLPVNFAVIKANLSEPRKNQAAFLLNIIELTKLSSDEREKASILSAAVYYVYEEINSTYCLRQSVNSILFTSLKNALGLSEDNWPTSQNIIDMYASLNLFLKNQVYRSGLSQRGDNEVFSFKEVDRSYIIDVIKNLLKHIADLKIQAIQQELTAELQAMEDANQPKASLSSTYNLLRNVWFESKKNIDSASSSPRQEEKTATVGHR